MGYTPIPPPPRPRPPLTALDATVEAQLELGAQRYVDGTLDLDGLGQWIDGALADYVERRDNPPPLMAVAVWGAGPTLGEAVYG